MCIVFSPPTEPTEEAFGRREGTSIAVGCTPVTSAIVQQCVGGDCWSGFSLWLVLERVGLRD